MTNQTAVARKDVGELAVVGSPSPQCLSGDHCPDCFNAGYDAGRSGANALGRRVEIAVNTCKDVTTLRRFAACVDPVRWVEQLQSFLENGEEGDE